MLIGLGVKSRTHRIPKDALVAAVVYVGVIIRLVSAVDGLNGIISVSSSCGSPTGIVDLRHCL